LEQSPEIRDEGAGLSIWANAVGALRTLGLERQAIASGSVIERTLMMTHQGRVLTETDIAALGRDAGAVSICIHRAELRRILLEALPPDSVRTGARCVSFEGACARLEDGSSVAGDILVGADGIRSAVRAQLHGSSEPRRAGYAAWRGVAEGEWLPRGTAILAAGPGGQAGLFPCGKGRVYWFTTRQGPWPEPIASAIRATPSEAVLCNDVTDRPPSPKWGEGPVTLLGDAAHPTTPNMGQGACQALEDAVALADCVAKGLSLRDYERRRMPRTAMITRESWRMGKMLQMENRLAIKARNWVATTPFGRRQGEKMLRRMILPNDQ
jgi:2-polyprenyl-6-methoxyphenol hydroxylase-like FAD-dependent oxidoreductase